jgi:hypothetical protein
MARRDFDPRTAVPDLLAVVAYAEMRAVMLAWAQTSAPDVRELAHRAMLHAVETRPARPIVAVAREHVRAVTSEALARTAARLGPWPWDRIVARGQLGTLDGVERCFHAAGEAAAQHRSHDVRVLAAAVTLADELRRTLNRS